MARLCDHRSEASHQQFSHEYDGVILHQSLEEIFEVIGHVSCRLIALACCENALETSATLDRDRE